eukprot:439909-Amphidinium_carterae.2
MVEQMEAQSAPCVVTSSDCIFDFKIEAIYAQDIALQSAALLICTEPVVLCMPFRNMDAPTRIQLLSKTIMAFVVGLVLTDIVHRVSLLVAYLLVLV